MGGRGRGGGGQGMTVVIHETWAAIAKRRKQSISYDGEKYGEKNAEIKEGDNLSFFLSFLTVYFDFLNKYYKLYVYCTGVSVITIVTLAVVLLPPFSAADFSKLEPAPRSFQPNLLRVFCRAGRPPFPICSR